MPIIATTATRVSSNTAQEVNQRIERETEARVASLAVQGQAAVDARLQALDKK